MCDAQSVLSACEHSILATCLCVAAFSLRSHLGEGGPTEAENAVGMRAVAFAKAGGFFQYSLLGIFPPNHQDAQPTKKQKDTNIESRIEKILACC